MYEAHPTEILELIKTLLGENGCNWDKQQSPASLCDYLLEESYELVEAVVAGTRPKSGKNSETFFSCFFSWLCSYTVNRGSNWPGSGRRTSKR